MKKKGLTEGMVKTGGIKPDSTKERPPAPKSQHEDNKIDYMEQLANAGGAVITVVEWTCAPNGETYRYLWAAKWRIVTDKLLGEGFRSTEHWQLWGYDRDDKLKIIIPGCQVKGVVLGHPPIECSGKSHDLHGWLGIMKSKATLDEHTCEYCKEMHDFELSYDLIPPYPEADETDYDEDGEYIGINKCTSKSGCRCFIDD